MSARFYPRYVKGNPQLRIFLPDWKMVMVKPKDKMPDNIVSFKTDPRMTDWDIKNYLEKIYNVQVAAVNSRIYAGDLYRARNVVSIAKKDDYKIAHVTLPIGQTFEWPDLFPKKKFEEDKKDAELVQKEMNTLLTKDKNVHDVPSWFV